MPQFEQLWQSLAAVSPETRNKVATVIQEQQQTGPAQMLSLIHI